MRILLPISFQQLMLTYDCWDIQEIGSCSTPATKTSECKDGLFDCCGAGGIASLA